MISIDEPEARFTIWMEGLPYVRDARRGRTLSFRMEARRRGAVQRKTRMVRAVSVAIPTASRAITTASSVSMS